MDVYLYDKAYSDDEPVECIEGIKSFLTNEDYTVWMLYDVENPGPKKVPKAVVNLGDWSLMEFD